jgi:hypothetical protein
MAAHRGLGGAVAVSTSATALQASAGNAPRTRNPRQLQTNRQGCHAPADHACFRRAKAATLRGEVL